MLTPKVGSSMIAANQGAVGYWDFARGIKNPLTPEPVA